MNFLTQGKTWDVYVWFKNILKTNKHGLFGSDELAGSVGRPSGFFEQNLTEIYWTFGVRIEEKIHFIRNKKITLMRCDALKNYFLKCL
jgi:hypothetical protein